MVPLVPVAPPQTDVWDTQAPQMPRLRPRHDVDRTFPSTAGRVPVTIKFKAPAAIAGLQDRATKRTANRSFMWVNARAAAMRRAGYTLLHEPATLPLQPSEPPQQPARLHLAARLDTQQRTDCIGIRAHC